MSILRRWFLTAVAAVSLIVPASADRATDVLDALEAELAARDAENGGDDKKLAKLLAANLAKLSKTRETLLAELKLAKGILGGLEKKFAADAEMLGLIEDATDAYTALVQAAIDDLAAGVDEVTAAKPVPALAQGLLDAARAKLAKAGSAQNAKAALANLIAALLKTVKGQSVVDRILGGGGGTLCGPQFYRDPVSLLRVRGQGESMTATVGTSQFSADSLVATIHPFLANTILVGGFQCSPELDLEFTFPANPTLDLEMTQGTHPTVSATSADCFECLQTVAGNVRVTITHYDAGGGRISGTFSFNGHESVTDGTFTVQSWRTGP
ncbi:MAG: hypothetical protein HMLKMBBP_00837 [Planctomycetes bacterium]|nr:hypothetical protein [Planctomycetota bacterium]